jgi:DNA primase
MLVDEIKNRVSIIELARYLGCEVNGSGFTNSIYKDEQNPSLKFYKDTNSYYCFATGTGGDVIKFYADFNQIEMKQAIKELADRYSIINKSSAGFTRTKSIEDRKTQTIKCYLLNDERYFFDERAAVLEFDGGLSRERAEEEAWEQLLINRKETQILIYESLEKFCFGVDEESLNYLTGNKRGISLETIRKFRLFSIQDIEATDAYLRDCFSISDLIISGLYSKEGKFIFRRHRIIIPFIENNKIVYLRGRFFNEGNSISTNTGKYIGLNNFATNLTARRFYNKNILSSLQKGSKLLICEGEFDCMIAEQEGQNAIGIPGANNFPKEEINLLDNYEIYLAFDNDEAGEEAIKKIAELFNKPIKAIKLKNHKDITELIIDANKS